jgi:acyl carrier protein
MTAAANMTTLERLQALLARDFDLKVELLQPAATLEGMNIDSLRMIEILFCVEDEFKISVPAEQTELRARVKTLGDLAGYIDELAAVQGKAAP